MTMKRPGRRQPRKTRLSLDPGRIGILSQVHRLLKHDRARGYVVGGFLRDLLLGKPSNDLDLVVSNVEPADFALQLHRHMGLSRPVVFPRFKTALTVGKGVKIEVCRFQGSLEEDAAGRDFTLNCLYADLGALVVAGGAGAVLDPTGLGLTDLDRGILRTPIDPCSTLWLDPLRILRALRLSAVHGFKLDSDLRGCIPRLVYLVSKVAQERVRAELETMLISNRVISCFRAMQALGVCEAVLPELSRTHGFDQATPYHAYDLFTHTLKATANVPADIALRLAALLHDLGKPGARSMKRGRAVYYGHQDLSAELAEGLLRRLKFPRRIRDSVVFLVRNHMIHYSPTWSDKAVRRFVRRMGPDLDKILLLAEADQKAQVPGAHPEIPAEDLRGRIRGLRESGGFHLGLPMDGHEIMSILGIDQGPLVGMAKNKLAEEVSLRDRPMSREEAVEVLKKWAKSQELR